MGSLRRFSVLPALLAVLILPLYGAAQESGDDLARKVRHELVMLPYYDVFDNLEFKVQGRDVTLYGQVTRPTLKDDAERAVRGIEGVESVNNEIEVLPVSPLDDEIRLRAYRAIFGNPALQRYALQPVPPIHIIVKNGHITLVGVVDSEFDKTIANMQANSVPNVFSVTDDLRVD